MTSISRPTGVRTYQMVERSAHLDFDVRERDVRAPITEPHRHEYYQLQFNVLGDSTFHIGGAVRPWREGALAFTLPYRVHMNPHPEGSRYVVVSFTQQFLRPELDVDPLDLDEVPLTVAPELAPFQFQELMDYDLDGDDLLRVQRILQDMKFENANRSFGSLEVLRGLLLQLIGVVCRRYQAPLLALAASHAQKNSRSEALRRVTRYVREHLAEEISLTDAAAAAFLSPNYLTHLLKRETGRTFTDLVTERRLDQARELLAGTALRISEVAAQSGFNDEAYFTRRFKQWQGHTPRAYREAIRSALLNGHSYMPAV